MSIEPNPIGVQCNGIIYALCDPHTGEHRYVGQTRVDPLHRLRGHLKGSKTGNNHRENWIRSLLNAGLEPVLVVLQDAIASIEALHDAERYWISLGLKRDWRLTNATDGGEGGMSSETAKTTWSPERRLRWIAGIKAVWVKPAVKEDIREKFRTAWADPEVREKHRVSATGRKLSDEHRAKVAASWVGADERRAKQRERASSPEARDKTREAWAQPGEREKRGAAISAGKKGVPLTTEHRAALTEAWKRRRAVKCQSN